MRILRCGLTKICYGFRFHNDFLEESEGESIECVHDLKKHSLVWPDCFFWCIGWGKGLVKNIIRNSHWGQKLYNLASPGPEINSTNTVVAQDPFSPLHRKSGLATICLVYKQDLCIGMCNYIAAHINNYNEITSTEESNHGIMIGHFY